jgi:hypothetical protein
MTIILMTVSQPAFTQEESKKTNPANYLSPPIKYSLIGKNEALIYQPQLLSLAGRIDREIVKKNRFELLNQDQAPMAGLGFWVSPASFPASDAHYLGIAVRVNIKLDYFNNDEWGRLNDALDAFGKDLFKIAETTLAQVPDPSIKGVELVVIYSRSELESPDYMDNAEATVIFISRENLQNFNNYHLTLGRLFDLSNYYYFRGRYQIQMMLNEFVRG